MGQREVKYLMLNKEELWMKEKEKKWRLKSILMNKLLARKNKKMMKNKLNFQSTKNKEKCMKNSKLKLHNKRVKQEHEKFNIKIIFWNKCKNKKVLQRQVLLFFAHEIIINIQTKHTYN